MTISAVWLVGMHTTGLRQIVTVKGKETKPKSLDLQSLCTHTIKFPFPWDLGQLIKGTQHRYEIDR